MTGEITAQFDPAQFREFMRRVKQFSPSLSTALRRRLRQAGADAVKDMRDTVLNGSDGRGIRTAIASGIKTTVATGAARQGIRIEASGAKLSPKHRQMLRLYNKPTFRHPVYGRGPWVTQQGRPFFGSIIRRHEDTMRAAILDALNDAVKEMEN